MLLNFLADLERRRLRQKDIPEHVAIIMDGNGRWARQRGLPRLQGHARGAQALKKAIEESARLGIKFLSVYAFSTENWKRPKTEVEGLFKLFIETLTKENRKLVNNKIQVRFLGDLEKFSPELQKLMVKTERETTFAQRHLQLNILLNYGSRQEIIQAINKIIAKKVSAVTEESFSSFLYTKGIPDPDLLIRTSGEFRLSNFMLWQSAYTEFWFSKIYWPDFSAKTLRQAIRIFQKRVRRKGGL